MPTQPVLQALNEQLGLTQPRLDDPDGCSLDLDGDIHVDAYYMAHHDSLFLCATVGAVFANSRPQMLRHLLAANLAPALCADAHFAFDAAEDEVTLCRTVALSQRNVTEVLDVIGHLAATTRQWRETLSREQLLT